MKTRFLRIISGMALAAILALRVRPVLAKTAGTRGARNRRRLGCKRHSSVCATGAALFTGRAILMFIDGGTLTEIADRANRSTGLGTWRHIGGRSYTALEKFIDYTATAGVYCRSASGGLVAP